MNSSSRHTRKHSSEVSATALPIRQSPRLLVERGNEAGLLLRSTVMPREAGLWVGRITHDPWPLQGARRTRWRSSMLDAVPGLPGALVDPDAAPLVLYSPGVSGIRFWWGGPLEEGASTVGEVPDRDSGSVFRKVFCLPSPVFFFPSRLGRPT